MRLAILTWFGAITPLAIVPAVTTGLSLLTAVNTLKQAEIIVFFICEYCEQSWVNGHFRLIGWIIGSSRVINRMIIKRRHCRSIVSLVMYHKVKIGLES